MTDLSDLKRPSYKELLAQREALEAQINAVYTEHRTEAKSKVMELIAEYDFSAIELGLIKTQKLKAGKNGDPTFPAKDKRSSAEPKYRDPETGVTWSGRGRQPRWIKGSRDEYLIA